MLNIHRKVLCILIITLHDEGLQLYYNSTYQQVSEKIRDISLILAGTHNPFFSHVIEITA